MAFDDLGEELSEMFGELQQFDRSGDGYVVWDRPNVSRYKLPTPERRAYLAAWARAAYARNREAVLERARVAYARAPEPARKRALARYHAKKSAA